ncbi:MAG: NAD(+) diphosphatase [Fibrobacteraceae bacterium]|nr:NAD(+) diphosphatase [Fibrobacteraceae bacterium]
MIHEIEPHKFDNQFDIRKPQASDYLVCYNGSKALLKKDGDNFVVPTVGDFYKDKNNGGSAPDVVTKNVINNFKGHYLFSIDDKAYFLEHWTDASAKMEDTPTDEYQWVVNRTFRHLSHITQRLGGATAAHLAHWETLNRFCGKCGCKTKLGNTERSLVCPSCNNVVYPRISPVVIIAVRNGNKLLMARNWNNPNPRLFLISGFVEIGESLEQAAHREVLEETGVNIKNVRYFGSQPWPFSDSLIAGFTAELDGDDTIYKQETELSEAKWVDREDIPPYETDVSISCCLIENFRTGFTLAQS